MSEKLIIVNHTDLPMESVLSLAQRVVKLGRISNDAKQYCYCTIIRENGAEYSILSDLNTKSDKLTIYKETTPCEPS